MALGVLVKRKGAGVARPGTPAPHTDKETTLTARVIMADVSRLSSAHPGAGRVGSVPGQSPGACRAGSAGPGMFSRPRPEERP